MLRGVIICPDRELSAALEEAVQKTRRVGILRTLEGYPGELDLVRFLRATAPEVVFLGLGNSQQALAVAAGMEAHAPGMQIVAIGRTVQREVLLETMRAGIREFLGLPFEAGAVQEMIARSGNCGASAGRRSNRPSACCRFCRRSPGWAARRSR